ncbi:ComE operon protein 3 [Anaerolineae bacterium]|nr:ComE operon protein 3 [Anaerolineae bacterium]
MPFIYLGTGWFIGIWAASALSLPIEILLLFGLIAFIGFALWRDSRRAKLMWLGVLFAALGGGRYLLSVPHFDHTSLSTYNNTGEVTLEGVIVAEPDVRDTYINLRINADRLTLPDQQTYSINGLLLTRPSRPNEFRYGDRVRASGELVAPPEFATFSYKDFLARQGIYSMIDRPRVSLIAHDQGSPILAAIFGFRAHARDVIAQILPEPSASLLTGILLGDDAGLPVDVQNDFRSTGTTHIIAISGYNITILIGLMSAVTIGFVGRRRAFFVMLIGLTAYAIMVGGSASVVRATVMGLLLLWADYLGRQYAAPNALFASGLLMTAIDPNTLFDIGFQLSFVATLGLMIYARPFANVTEQWLTRLFSNATARQVVGVLNDAVLVTLAAQVATLPLLVFYFRQLSIVSLIVNPLVLPAQTGVMVFGLLALGGGLIAIPVGQVLGWLAWVFLAWTLGVIGIFASMPNAAIPMDYVSPIWIAAYYAILLGATWYLKRPSDQRPKKFAQLLTRRNLIVSGGLAAVLIGVAWSWQPDRQLHVIALAVDDHPVLVRTVEGRTILIGGSRSPSGLLAALGEQLPFWERTIDLMIVPRAETAQLNSLVAVLDRYTVKQIMAVEVPTTNRAGGDWRGALSKIAQQPIELQRLELEPQVVIDFDQASVIINDAIAIGVSERAPVNVIAAPADRLPAAPQLLFTWLALPDPRVVNLTDRGRLDLGVTDTGLMIYTDH